jgi:hypothetical protein
MGARRLAWLGTLALVACRAPELALAPSFLPNLGLAGAVAAPLRRGGPWSLEARFTDQFLDDKAFADNTLPAAGNWTQLDLGLRRAGAEEDGRAWSTRLGLVAFEARGEPNLVEQAGDYFGAYWGIGRTTRLGATLAFGPEVTLVAAHGPDPRVLFPQLTWGLRWSPGRAQGSKRRASSGGTRGHAPAGRGRRSRRARATAS